MKQKKKEHKKWPIVERGTWKRKNKTSRGTKRFPKPARKILNKLELEKKDWKCDAFKKKTTRAKGH